MVFVYACTRDYTKEDEDEDDVSDTEEEEEDEDTGETEGDEEIPYEKPPMSIEFEEVRQKTILPVSLESTDTQKRHKSSCHL